MNKKQTIKKTAALLLGLGLAIGTTGCGFITTDHQKDLDQTVAEVKIEKVLAEENSPVAEEFKKFKFSGDIKKRELISYYMSIGYQYVDSYGYTKEQAYTLLLNALVNREILGQQAAAWFLENDDTFTAAGYEAYKTAELNAASDEVKLLLQKYEDVLKYKYFLTKGGADTTDYDIAVYTLKKNINSSIDSLESAYITAEDEEHNHETARTLPTGVDTEIEDYYVKEGYDVYTARNNQAVDAIVGYEKVEGSTPLSRQKAYNAFLTNLQDYNLVSTGGSVENTSRVENLEYYYVELGSLLEQRLINNYYEKLEEAVVVNEAYVTNQYNRLYETNKRDYESNATGFGTALDSASEDSYLLYAPANQDNDGNDMIFGYVYNILLPFSTSQNVEYTEKKNDGLLTSELFAARRDIGMRIEGKDLRTSWISKHDHADHSYKGDDGKFYFFGENDGSKYEELTQYAGNYAFNGNVEEVEGEDDYKLTPNKLNIDAFMAEFEGYINTTLGYNAAAGAVETSYMTNDFYKTDDPDEIDYSKFIYYTGKVSFNSAQTSAGFFDKTTDQYKALSAVNELMFAYSTDTGCLNTYMGYSVSPYGTNFVKEFEKAAQDVVKAGVGSYAVCLTDYGWHIVYCSFSFNQAYMTDANAVYGGYNHAEHETEGTFSNQFFEYVKEAAYTNHTTEVQNNTLTKYDNDTCITRYENRYNDLFND